MEETKRASGVEFHEQQRQQPSQDSAHALKPQPPTASESVPSVEVEKQNGAGKKRKLDAVGFQNSVYFKLLAVVRDLRPYFIEVLGAPDFRGCKAIHDIRKQMKVMLELSKQLRVETASNLKQDTDSQARKQDESLQSCEIPAELDPAAEKPSQLDEIHKSLNTPDAHKAPESTKVLSPLNCTSEVPEAAILEADDIEQQLQGIKRTYVVGGSPMGWNFLIYPSTEPVYYGVSKETWLAKQKDNPQYPKNC